MPVLLARREVKRATFNQLYLLNHKMAPPSSLGDSSSDDGSDFSDDTDHLGATHQRTPSADPHRQRTRNWREFLESHGLLVNRILLVIAHMESLQIDLPILLWAISWNVPELTSNPHIRFARTSLMVSEELPVILSRWHKPPRTHSTGIRTHAACETMNEWALDAVDSAK